MWVSICAELLVILIRKSRLLYLIFRRNTSNAKNRKIGQTAYLKASKSYQRGESDPEPRELVIMKTAEAREKQKVDKRKTRMRELKRFSFWTETVEWKWWWGVGIRAWGDGVPPPLRSDWGDRMVAVAVAVCYR